MEFVIFLVFILIAVVRGAQSKEAQKKKEAAASRPASSTAVHASHTTYRAANRPYNDPEQYVPNKYHSDRPAATNGRQFANQAFDSVHYHSEGYDFDSSISFSGLPQGTDELKYLHVMNGRHEKDLEKLLQISER